MLDPDAWTMLLSEGGVSVILLAMVVYMAKELKMWVKGMTDKLIELSEKQMERQAETVAAINELTKAFERLSNK